MACGRWLAANTRTAASPDCGRDSVWSKLGATLMAIVLGMALYVLTSPLLALGHEVLVLVAAEILGELGDLAHSGAVARSLPLDPIYTGALLLTLGGIEVHGVAVAEPVGGFLELVWPAVFEPASLVAPGAWASAVVAPGATIVSRWAASLAADAVILVVGALMVRLGARRPWLALGGAIVQAQVVVGYLVDAPPDLADVEAAGIPFALAMVLSGDVQAGPRLAEALEALSPAVRDAILGASMVMLAYLPLVVLVGAPWAGRRVRWAVAACVRRRSGMPLRGRAAHGREHGLGRDVAGRPALAPGWRVHAPSLSLPWRLTGLPGWLSGLTARLAALGLAAAVAASPLGNLTDARTHYLAAADLTLRGEAAGGVPAWEFLPPLDSLSPVHSLAPVDPAAPLDSPVPARPAPVALSEPPAASARPARQDGPAPLEPVAPAEAVAAKDTLRSDEQTVPFVARGDDWARTGMSGPVAPASGADSTPPLELAGAAPPAEPIAEPGTNLFTPTPALDAPAASSVATAGEPGVAAGSPEPPEPSAVAVAGARYRYVYTVNGTPEQVRGMGYNVRYRDLPPDERARRLDRDFAVLRRTGVNTVFGWEAREFDEVLLDAAQRHGLGVAPPFELDPDAAYDDPAVRAQIEAEVVAWVERYRAHPAPRMWAIGNEVLHKLVSPSWMPVRPDPKRDARARAFGRFYVTLLDRVHALDPRHPVVYRDAEDAYVRWMREALAAGPRRPWFVYGVNVYTPRLTAILTQWPSQGFDVPLLVSEFAPGGMTPADRPAGFRAMWTTIEKADQYVLGGSVYAWTTDGPEEVDRVFGLTDGDGRPVSGVLATLTGLFRDGEPDVGADASGGDG